jgi:hypothetical protein
MKRILLFLLALLPAFFPLFAENWTVLVYMAADNDLAPQALENIAQMETAIQPDGLNLVVQADIEGSGARRYKINYNPQAGINSPVVQNLGNIDSGDPTTLKSFLDWGFSRYPSARKMLILWSHADSWYNKNKYIAPDLDTGNAIGIANHELSSVLAASAHLDILLFDACSMQSIEIAYELRHYADFIVGSADLVPVKGFPYAHMIPLFTGQAEALAGAIPEVYTDSYLPGTPNNPSNHYLTTTCSTLKSSELSGFYQAFSDFSHSLFPHVQAMADLRAELYEMNSGYADVDICQMLTRMLQKGILPHDSARLLNSLENAIISSSYTLPYIETDLQSLALWFPDIRMNLNNAWEVYMQLEFAQSGWLSAVNAIIGEDQDPPDAPELIHSEQRHGMLHLDIRCPQDPDSLYYHLRADHADYYIYPPEYAGVFHTSFPVNSSGSLSLHALDRVGNSSKALLHSYVYQEPDFGIIFKPNPVRSGKPAFVDWFADTSETGYMRLSIYNIKGERVLRESYTGFGEQYNSLRIDDISGFEKLKRGVYIMEIRTANSSFRSKFSIL